MSSFESAAHCPCCCVQVRVLGALAMVDEGEMDWKVIVIDTRDPAGKGVKGSHFSSLLPSSHTFRPEVTGKGVPW
jgi:inorganic pyrophosphatase